jgi:hypothetical protein
MDLRDYPRPPDDTGIGVHWSAGYPAPNGIGQVRDVWLPELLALGVKWVKIARGDGGTAFDELLLNSGIMPIVRLYRPQPNPGTLDDTQVRLLREHVAAGVRYFEFNNEPDLGHEWAKANLPPNGLEIVARNAIRDMETILAAGGYPGIPAVAVGCKWDLVGEICRQGRRDLLREGVWQAVHNYSLNHPVDYPYDAGNRQGAPYSQQFYSSLTSERGIGTWSGRSLERVNQERASSRSPGANAFDDPSCWRGYERFDQLIRAQIGRSLPILGTEDGYIVGEAYDTRYPATTPSLHAAQTVEACRTLMDTSSRYERAPDWFFCSAFWLLGNYTLGHYASEWEGAAWYSGQWPGGKLPTVAALKAEPKRARQWHGDGGIACAVSGHVKNGSGVTLQLARGEAWVDKVLIGQDESYRFVDVPAESYELSVVEAPQFKQTVRLSAGQPEAQVDFDLAGVDIPHEESTVAGTVSGGAGMSLRLGRPADGWSRAQAVGADGSFRFSGLAKGTYVMVLDGTNVGRAEIVLDGKNTVEVNLSAPGWSWQVSDGGAGPGFGVLRCRVTGRAHASVHAWTADWAGVSQMTGTKPEYGPDVCELAPLGAGRYFVQVQAEAAGSFPQATVGMSGERITWLTYARTDAPAAKGSSVSGHIKGGAGRQLALRGPDEVRSATVAADETYKIAELCAGIYRLEVRTADGSAVEVAQDQIILDGQNQVTVDLELSGGATRGWRWRVEEKGPGSGFSILRCRVTGKPGVTVRLSTAGWSGLSQKTGSKPEYGADACEFAPLGAGTYQVEPEGLGVRADVPVAGNRVEWVYFEPTGQPSKTIDHYLLVGNLARTRDDFLAVLRYVKRFQPPLGSDPQEASQARHVTILGATNTISAAVEQNLRDAGCVVQRIEGNYAEGLGRLLAADVPY